MGCKLGYKQFTQNNFFSLTSQEVYFKYKTMQRLKAIMNVLIMLRFINLLNCSVATNQGVL